MAIISNQQVGYVGRFVQKRAPDLVSDAWMFSGSPRLLVRAKKRPTTTEIGRIAAVLNSTGPDTLSWMVIRHGAFSESNNVPAVTDKTTWHATEEGLSPHDIHPMPATRLRDIENEMSLIPSPPTDEH